MNKMNLVRLSNETFDSTKKELKIFPKNSEFS